MKLNLYAIYDKGVNCYLRPLIFQADGQALRWFSDEVLRGDSDMGRHPEDYAFFRVGSFDCDTAEVCGEEPRCLARAHELVSSGGVE